MRMFLRLNWALARREMPREPRPDNLARTAAGQPPEPRGTYAVAVGTVKYWGDAKGTGAIASEATAPWDIWCHLSATEAAGFRTLVPGERVEVAYYRGEQGSFK